MHLYGRLSLMRVALSSLNAIGCVSADWIPCLHLCINLNGGHVEHIVWIQAVFTFFPRVQTYHGAHYISVSIEGGKRKGKPVGVTVIHIGWGLGVHAQVGVLLTYASLLMIFSPTFTLLISQQPCFSFAFQDLVNRQIFSDSCFYLSN